MLRKLLALLLLLAVAACDSQSKSDVARAAGPIAITAGDPGNYDLSRQHVLEVCYKGVTYMYVADGNGSWGSVMLGPDSKIIPC